MKKLLKLVVLAGGAAMAAKMLGAKKAEWAGLTEPELRTKLDAKLGDRVPADKMQDIGDKIVEKMRDKGMLEEERDVTLPGNGADASGA